VRSRVGRVATACVFMSALAGCIEDETGFVQIKAVPVAAASQPSLYLDAVKLEPLKKGEAFLVQKAGTSKLQIEGWGGQLSLLCEVVVQKDRITTVTISTVQRPLRCQCSHASGQSPQGSRTCLS
jgi:hypothetical protein